MPYKLAKLPNCVDCGKKLQKITAIRCKKCNGLFRSGIRNPNYKHGETSNNRCVDCNKHIWWGSLRCKSCSVVEHHKQGTMNILNIANGNYIDGRSPLHKRIRACMHYKGWRKSVFERDNFECQNCGNNIGGNLVAHHKYYFNLIFTEFLNKYNFLHIQNDEEILLMLSKLFYMFWDKSNGITLCTNCHKEVHK